jgi:hypothetical protein
MVVVKKVFRCSSLLKAVKVIKPCLFSMFSANKVESILILNNSLLILSRVIEYFVFSGEFMEDDVFRFFITLDASNSP